MWLKTTTWTSRACATSIQQANSQCSSQIGYSTLQEAQHFQSALDGSYNSQSTSPRQQWLPTTLVGSAIHQRHPKWLSMAPQCTQVCNQPQWAHNVHYFASLTHKGTNQPSMDGKTPQATQRCFQGSQGLSLDCNSLNYNQQCTQVHNQPYWALKVHF